MSKSKQKKPSPTHFKIIDDGRVVVVEDELFKSKEIKNQEKAVRELAQALNI